MSTVTRSTGRSFMVGLALIGVMGLAAYVALTANQGRPLSRNIEVKAEFSDVGQLQPGDQVRQNSVQIGQVSDIEFTDGKAVVTMSLRGSKRIYADAKAAMWDQSALGQKFVEVVPGTKDSGPLVGAIPTKRTTSAMDIDRVLDVFDARTRKATGGTVRELGTGVAGRSQALHEFLKAAPDELDAVGRISAALSTPDADLPELLDNARDLSAQLGDHPGELRQLIGNADRTLRAAGVDQGQPLERTLQQLPPTLRDVRTVSSDLDKPLTDLDAAVTTLRPGVAALGESTPELRSVLRDGVEPLGKVPGVADQADPAVTGLTTTMKVARPVMPKARKLLADLSPLLDDLEPYHVDIPALAKGGAGFTNAPIKDSKGLVYNHVLIFPVVGYGTAAGLLPEGYNPYPSPGTATKDGSNAGSLVADLYGGDR